MDETSTCSSLSHILRQLKRGGNGWMREPPCESLLAFYAWAPLSRMGRMDLNRVLGCLSLPNYSCCSTCMCMSTLEDEDGFERKALMASDEMMKLREIFEGNKTLAFHLEPKTVVLRVSMHCHGCAKKVGKHISKMEGVTSFEVDLESKKVVVMGDITPFEVLESVSKVKSAELWIAP